MLGKLIKYDFRSCWRKFWPFWLAILVMSLLCGIGYRLEARLHDNVMRLLSGGLPFILLFFICSATLLVAIVYICRQFFTGLLGDPGYLMFTIPARTWQLISSKAIVALLLELLSLAAGMLGAGLFILIGKWEEMKVFFGDIAEAVRDHSLPQIPGDVIGFFLLLFLLALVFFLSVNLHVYASISIGHLARKNRVLLSVASYVGIGFLMTVIGILLGEMGIWANVVHALQVGALEANAAVGTLILGLIIECGIYFLVSHEILQHHLNLE